MEARLRECPWCASEVKAYKVKGTTYSLVGCETSQCPASEISCYPEQWNERATPTAPAANHVDAEHRLPNWLWCGRCTSWVETQHACRAQYVDKGTDFELVKEAVVLPVDAQAGDYIAWCRYVDDGNRIVLCDSDAKGAFKVYRATTQQEEE